jgi:hypothetical protein
MPWSVSAVFVMVSTHLQVSPVFPISPGVFIPVFPVSHSVPVCLDLPSQPVFFLAPIFPVSIFPSPPGFWTLPVLTPNPRAWPLCLFYPRACLSPCTVWTWFMKSRLSPTCFLPTPFVIIHIGAQPSASCVCIWVSPCALITSVTGATHTVLLWTLGVERSPKWGCNNIQYLLGCRHYFDG